MSLIYDLVLGAAVLLTAPFRKKKPSLAERLGRELPNPNGRLTLWVHAVSVGEVKAAQPLIQGLREKFPNSFILVTTTTATGQEEAHRCLKADAVRYLPFDFSWIAKKWAQQLQPRLLIFVEGDVWYHFAQAVKRRGGKTALVSGKISERSAKRFNLIRPIAKKYFDSLDLVLVQNEEYRNRLAPLTSRQPIIAGNLKLDQKPLPVDRKAIEKVWGAGPWLTVSCTHDPEEKLILEVLRPILNQVKVFLAPRHPERSTSVQQVLTELKLPFSLYDRSDASARLILVDRMGQLPLCYSLSFAAVLGGSFIPGIGGHNVREPILYGCPVFFGPFMHNQKEFRDLSLADGSGQQVELSALAEQLKKVFSLQGQSSCIPPDARIGATEKTLSLLLSI